MIVASDLFGSMTSQVGRTKSNEFFFRCIDHSCQPKCKISFNSLVTATESAMDYIRNADLVFKSELFYFLSLIITTKNLK